MTKYFDNINEILKILAAGSFEDLAGAVENDIFETKGKPWNLERKLEKFELAKDVASMANWRGGIILVGVVAKSTLTRPWDEVAEKQRYLPSALAPGDRYMHVLKDWLYPVPEGIDPRWYGYAKDSSRGIFSIHIPNQADDLRPFLVKQYFEGENKRLETTVCLVQRLGAHTKDTQIQELHTLLREGRRSNLIHQKLDAIIAKIEGGASSIRK